MLFRGNFLGRIFPGECPGGEFPGEFTGICPEKLSGVGPFAAAIPSDHGPYRLPASNNFVTVLTSMLNVVSMLNVNISCDAFML